jgi:dihydrodipicolinate synthase/N-acetylneuraminate lyase
MSTPFDAGGEVDPAAMRSNVTRWNGTGIRGVVALGSNGEAPLLDEKESDVVTRGTIDASRRAASLGADAVLVRTPTFFKPRMTADGVQPALTVRALR